MIFNVMAPLQLPPVGGAREAATKMLRVMKLTAFLLFVAILHVSAHGLAQDRVTFSGNNVSLDKVFSAIKQQTSYLFLYNDALLENTRKVTINVKDASIEDVMRVCAKDQPFDYTIKGKTIFIINKEEKPTVEKQSPRAPTPGKDVKGRVVNNNGEPVQGATIKVKETGAMIVADANGEFELTGLENNNTLIISSVGHETVQIKYTGLGFLDIMLKQVIGALDETVVKGYYNTTKRLNTGNVSTVKGEDIQKQPVSDPILALEGRVPGLYISQTSGIPGAYSTVRLRGQNSIANGNNPLYIVDGVPFTSSSMTTTYVGGGALGSPGNAQNQGLSPFNNLNTADIESIEVLKDADATAIYGSRGANGVILITTRKGKAGKTKVDLDVSSAMGKVAHMMPLMNTEQYLEMRKEAFANDGKTPGASDLDLNGTWDQNSYTDWQKIFIGGTAHFNNAQASLSGGNNNTQFLIAGGYSKQTTVYPGDFSDQKTSLNFNINHNSSDKKFQALFSGGYIKDNNQLPGSDIAGSITIAPNAPSKLIDENGNLIWTNPFGNPFSLLKRSSNSITDNLIGNLKLSYEILPGLEAKGSFGYTHIRLDQDLIIPAIAFSPPASPSLRIHSQGSNNIETWIAEPQLNYTKTIKAGKLSVLVGTTFQENSQNSFGIRGTNFTSDDQVQNIALAPSLTILGNNKALYHYSALYGRVNYDWKGKFLVNLTGRRDGSSRFGPGKQFGNFGAVGAGWIFSQEKFVQNNLPYLSFGKLRVSYGSTGNDQLGDYAFLSTYIPYNTSTYQGIIGLTPQGLTNPFFGWETVKKLEGGIELGFLHDRITMNLNYYQNRTGNQLVGYALPTTTGFTRITANLPAVIQNTGVELALNTANVKTKGFSWNSSLNISVPRNKLVSYPGLASSSYATVYVEGRSLFIQRKYHVLGIDPQTGTYQIEDLNKDGNINSNDFQFVKEVKQNYYGGFENSFSYKGLELDILFQFVKQTGTDFIATIPGYFGGGNGNEPTSLLNRWQSTGDNPSFQKYTQQVGDATTAWNNGISNGDYSIRDASFIRLKNIAISYRLPAKWVKLAGLNEVRLLFQGQNMLTITNYKGLDPETQGKSLPPLRMVNFGLHVSL